MSKKVLIIRPKVMLDRKIMEQISKDLPESLKNFGVILLDPCLDYEFGEINGVIWEGEEKEEKTPSVDWDAIFTELENLERDAYIDYDNYKSGWNDALEHAKRVIEQYKEKEEN